MARDKMQRSESKVVVGNWIVSSRFMVINQSQNFKARGQSLRSGSNTKASGQRSEVKGQS